jgi:hypothetical protein
MAQNRQWMQANGLTGHSDFAYYGNMAQSGEVYESVKTYFRSAGQYTVNPRFVETLPPIDPWRMKAWGTQGSGEPLANLTGYVDTAIDRAVCASSCGTRIWVARWTGCLTTSRRRDEGKLEVVTP